MTIRPQGSLEGGSLDACPIDRRVADVKAEIDAFFRDVPSSRYLAAGVSLSVSRLQHLFRKQIGIPIGRYLLHRRLSEAASLLAGSYLRVSEICYATGFNDPAGFSRAFRRFYGKSPREYRRRALLGGGVGLGAPIPDVPGPPRTEAAAGTKE
jgi:AraC-like DNA-binding protein